jgi:hypothetical protein
MPSERDMLATNLMRKAKAQGQPHMFSCPPGIVGGGGGGERHGNISLHPTDNSEAFEMQL